MRQVMADMVFLRQMTPNVDGKDNHSISILHVVLFAPFRPCVPFGLSCMYDTASWTYLIFRQAIKFWLRSHQVVCSSKGTNIHGRRILSENSYNSYYVAVQVIFVFFCLHEQTCCHGSQLAQVNARQDGLKGGPNLTSNQLIHVGFMSSAASRGFWWDGLLLGLDYANAGHRLPHKNSPWDLR